VDSARNHYVLAEKLWTDRNYSAAVSEFEKVILKDPRGKLGLQALYRAAMTQHLFLGQYNDAIRKFQSYIQGSADLNAIWEAQLQIGEILYSKTESYDLVIYHYRSLLKQKPNATEAPEFLFKIGKSYFYQFQFGEAVTVYQELMKAFPRSPWAEKAMYEIGATYFTRGEQGSESQSSDHEAYEEAIQAFRKFIQRYPQSRFLAEAKFGIASCLEELDQLEPAYHAYTELKQSYPSPNVIEIKLIRIRERIAQRKSSR
jgi:TolA-binding protein